MEIGDKVKITNAGFIYSGFGEMFIKMGFKNTKSNSSNVSCKTWICEVFAKENHPFYEEHQSVPKHLYGIRSVESGKELLIDGNGLELYTEPVSKRKIKFSYKFGNISAGGYRHFPILYFAYGRDGFLFTVLGLTTTIKYK